MSEKGWYRCAVGRCLVCVFDTMNRCRSDRARRRNQKWCRASPGLIFILRYITRPALTGTSITLLLCWGGGEQQQKEEERRRRCDAGKEEASQAHRSRAEEENTGQLIARLRVIYFFKSSTASSGAAVERRYARRLVFAMRTAIVCFAWLFAQGSQGSAQKLCAIPYVRNVYVRDLAVENARTPIKAKLIDRRSIKICHHLSHWILRGAMCGSCMTKLCRRNLAKWLRGCFVPPWHHYWSF